MTKLEVSLPDEERQFVELRVAEGEFESESDYVLELIRRDRGHLSRNRVNQLLLEGLD